MRGPAVPQASLRCPTYLETDAALFTNRDLHSVNRNSPSIRVTSPLFGIIAIALMFVIGGPILRQRPWSSPSALAAAVVPESESLQEPNPAEGSAPVLILSTPMALDPTPTDLPTQEPSQPTVTPILDPTAAPPEQTGPALALAQLPEASSCPERIVAPAIALDQPIITVGWHQETVNDKLVSVWDVAQYAVGWHKNSQYPGQGGNVVLAGHNNIYGEVFRRLDELKPGDLITLYADGRAYEYAVESSVIVKEEGATPEEKAANVRWIGPFADERLTLVACYPYTGNSHRILIIARPRFTVS